MRSAILTLALLALAGPAAAWYAINRLQVNPLPDGAGFEVIGLSGSGGNDYWCSAGDYAQIVLGAAGAQRLYILKGLGQPVTSNRRSGVQFTLTPPAGADLTPAMSNAMKQVGDNMPVAMARNYCFDIVTIVP
jgi:hypothetical protein